LGDKTVKDKKQAGTELQQYAGGITVTLTTRAVVAQTLHGRLAPNEATRYEEENKPDSAF
jgi:hypothetical protein